MTRVFSASSPNTRASVVLRPYVTCEDVQIVVSPGRTSATAQDGAREAWLWQGQKYVADSLREAAGIAVSTLPRSTSVCSRSTTPLRRYGSRLSLPGSPCHSVHVAFSS